MSSFNGFFRSARWSLSAVNFADNTAYGAFSGDFTWATAPVNPSNAGYLNGFPFAAYSSCPLIATPTTSTSGETPFGGENPYPLGEPYSRENFNLTLRMIRMDTYAISAEVRSGDTPVDITANSFRFTAKWDYRDADADAVFVKTLSNGIVITDGPNGRCTVTIESEDTEALPLHETILNYDLQMTDIQGKRYTVLYGQLVVKPDVTQQ